ncbi:AAA family ATPase [Burkholderia seminalis]|uniref:AAA family ATPase n=1 Tax=Burkholderia seminalis TaxID=488731 RepID=UPI00264C4730|nr:AAA family ATPase [Burkholderia seminalis]MDN7587264.1 AAA family ATPase [Burkholderia seminalis]
MNRLNPFHIFFGTTFLVLKKNEAPVGSTMRLVLDQETKNHLSRYFRLQPKSNWFFTPFQIKKNENRWRKPKYASTSLQAINTQSFGDALIHTKGEPIWGWKENYISTLSEKLPKENKIPLIDMAVWFSREKSFDDNATPSLVVSQFVSEFNLTNEEINALFSTLDEEMWVDEQFFSSTIAKPQDIVDGFGVPDDVPRDGGSILQFLEFSNLGPVRRMQCTPGSRFNIITGDNGLGKTFFLDIVWWALTREWADHMIVPNEPIATPPVITFSVSTEPDSNRISSEFQSKPYRWKVPTVPSVSGLVIYARVDGSFAVWDPATASTENTGDRSRKPFLSFTRESVWTGDSNCEGLLRDWVRWQTRSSEFPAFETFKKIIQRLKPPDLGDFSIGNPQRVRGWPMEIPTLIHPYGTVPIVFESAGIRRILTLTYLVVWAWEEHKIQAKANGRKEERQMVILLDEAEAHLHPRWQRVLLRALLGIAQDLHNELSIQYFIASHSPLVLASAESIWNAERDKLFHLHMNDAGKVNFDEMDFEIRGSVDSWLQSPSFDELHPGSESAERALNDAKSLIEKKQPSQDEIRLASSALASHLAADDPFWMRWIIFALQHGVEL